MVSKELELRTPDGTADALLIRPDGPPNLPGVILLVDGIGYRQAFIDLSARFANEGFAVLTPNVFYRTRKPPAFDFPPDFGSERAMTRFKELTAPLTPDAMARDGSAYVDFLSSQPFVGPGPMGVVGFCFTGQFALRIAAARPDRIAAAASFHGGGLFTETPHSPHLALPDVKARLYFGHADNDRSMAAEAIGKLDTALAAWRGVYESETYAGATHGWMIADRPVYNHEQSERGFAKLFALFRAAGVSRE
jgi:carboxymethylenebutenolidase